MAFVDSFRKCDKSKLSSSYSHNLEKLICVENKSRYYNWKAVKPSLKKKKEINSRTTWKTNALSKVHLMRLPQVENHWPTVNLVLQNLAQIFGIKIPPSICFSVQADTSFTNVAIHHRIASFLFTAYTTSLSKCIDCDLSTCIMNTLPYETRLWLLFHVT